MGYVKTAFPNLGGRCDALVEKAAEIAARNRKRWILWTRIVRLGEEMGLDEDTIHVTLGNCFDVFGLPAFVDWTGRVFKVCEARALIEGYTNGDEAAIARAKRCFVFYPLKGTAHDLR